MINEYHDLHPEPLVENHKMNTFYASGVYSFTIGCLVFLWDAMSSEKLNKKYFVGTLLFNVGCIFFIIDAHKSE